MNRQWLISRANPELVNYLSKTSSLSPVLTRILLNRGLKTTTAINAFLNAGPSGFTDPYELPGIKAAVDRVKKALAGNERILVAGDYDADGLTATAILVSALRAAGIEVYYFIPDRVIHGYGFNPPAVDKAKTLGAKLIITVDCGITSFDTAVYAKQKGIDVIITDHHEPLANAECGIRNAELNKTKNFLLPEAAAVINPKLQTQDSELSDLSGAGVAFKFVQALAGERELRLTEDVCLSLLDLAALGTVADVVPLLGENRILVKEGLRHIHDAQRPGIRALKQVSGLDGKNLKAGLLSFTIVPRINAAGRMGDAGEVVELFLAVSDDEAIPIAERLNVINIKRQQTELEIYQEAVEQLNRKGYDAAIVLWDKGWHIGVLGIVAAKLAEEFCRPAFVFSIKDDIAKGSARSIASFDIHKGVSACAETLLTFGGHKQAAGLKLHVSNLRVFEERINNIVKAELKTADFLAALQIDAQVALAEISFELIADIARLAPFGYGNPEPLLGAKKLKALYPKVVGSNHLKLKLRQSSTSMDAIGFDMGKLLEGFDYSANMDAAFTPTVNEWNNGQYLQLNLKALRNSL